MSWIKLREDLEDDPAVSFIASRCGVTDCHAVGALARAWSWAGRLSEDGKVPLGTPEQLDKVTQTPGLALAMEEAGWLEIGSGTSGPKSTYLLFPKWDRHNDAGAKSRALAAERQRRKRVTLDRDEPVTDARDQRRGEEKREEKSSSASLRSAGGAGAPPAGELFEDGRSGPPQEAPPGPKPKDPPKPRKEPTGPQADAIRRWDEIWLESRGTPWAWNAKEAVAISRALTLAKGDLGLFEERARRLLADPPDAWTAQNASPSLLADRWNQLAVRVLKGGTSPTRDRAAAGLKRMEAEL